MPCVSRTSSGAALNIPFGQPGSVFQGCVHGYARSMLEQTQPTQPIIRFDDEVEVAARLVPQFGYEEAERIIEMSARTHRPVDRVIADAA